MSVGKGYEGRSPRPSGCPPGTVETHKYQMMQALGLRTTAELIRYALEHGLTTPPV